MRYPIIVSKLWPKVASCLEKLCGAFWRVGRAVLDPLEGTALADPAACTCAWSVTAVSKLWPKVASCPWKAVRGPLKRWEGSPGSLRRDSFCGQNCLYLPLECHSCLQALTQSRKLPMKSCAGPFEALGGQSLDPLDVTALADKAACILAPGVSQLSPSFDP